jgi:hypothetical protein
LIVAVRCGERPTERLAQAWNDLSHELPEPPATFLDDYFTRRNGGAKTDFQHLAEAGTLTDTPKAYQRIADLLDSRLQLAASTEKRCLAPQKTRARRRETSQ